MDRPLASTQRTNPSGCSNGRFRPYGIKSGQAVHGPASESPDLTKQPVRRAPQFKAFGLPDACPEPAVQDVLAPVELNAIANPLADHLFDAIEKEAGERPAPERDDDAATELLIRLGLAIAVAVCGEQSPQRVADLADIRLAIDTDM